MCHTPGLGPGCLGPITTSCHCSASQPSPPACPPLQGHELWGIQCCSWEQQPVLGPRAWRNRSDRLAPCWHAALCWPAAMASLTEAQDEARPHPAMPLNLMGSTEGLPPIPTSLWHSPISVPAHQRVTCPAGVCTCASPGGTVPTLRVSHCQHPDTQPQQSFFTA